MTRKSRTLSFVLVASAATLVFTAVNARNSAWQNDHQNYEFKHPMQVTCAEYLIPKRSIETTLLRGPRVSFTARRPSR